MAGLGDQLQEVAHDRRVGAQLAHASERRPPRLARRAQRGAAHASGRPAAVGRSARAAAGAAAGLVAGGAVQADAVDEGVRARVDRRDGGLRVRGPHRVRRREPPERPHAVHGEQLGRLGGHLALGEHGRELEQLRVERAHVGEAVQHVGHHRRAHRQQPWGVRLAEARRAVKLVRRVADARQRVEQARLGVGVVDVERRRRQHALRELVHRRVREHVVVGFARVDAPAPHRRLAQRYEHRLDACVVALGERALEPRHHVSAGARAAQHAEGDRLLLRVGGPARLARVQAAVA